MNPHVGPVADLVDPYFTTEVKNTGGFKPSSAASNYAIWWLRRNPGRWGLVAEGTTGLTKQLLLTCPDISVKETRSLSTDRVQRTYARVPHPEGEPLAHALERRPFAQRLYLPAVTRDEFNWSKAELADACKVARENLFPTGAP